MAQQPLSRLYGRKAIVTASTKGIGFAIARRLAQEGAKVIISSRKKENVEEATKMLLDEGFDVEGIVCHVSKQEDRKKLLGRTEKIGGLDILVSNAGVNPAVGPLFGCSESAWDKIFEVNVKSNFLLTREALPLLQRSKAGRIIYNSSYSAFSVIENLGPYAISKMALSSLTKQAAFCLGPDNITVNCIVPAIIKTEFSKVLLPNEQEEIKFLEMTSLKRFGEPEDISGVAAFLASDDAAYITGENIIVSGGMQSRI